MIPIRVWRKDLLNIGRSGAECLKYLQVSCTFFRFGYYKCHLTGVILLTCLLVGGIFYGWPAYVFILKEEEVFYDLCNATVTAPILNNLTQPDDMVKHCVEQDTFFNMLFVVGCALSNICGMLFGTNFLFHFLSLL